MLSGARSSRAGYYRVQSRRDEFETQGLLNAGRALHAANRLMMANQSGQYFFIKIMRLWFSSWAPIRCTACGKRQAAGNPHLGNMLGWVARRRLLRHVTVARITRFTAKNHVRYHAIMPLAFGHAKISSWARVTSRCAHPIAANALSHSHWCAYTLGDGTLYLPWSFPRRISLHSVSKSIGSGADCSVSHLYYLLYKTSAAYALVLLAIVGVTMGNPGRWANCMTACSSSFYCL